MAAPLPVLDLAQSEPDALARELDEALRTSGFLLVVHHGVPDELAAEVRAAAHRFFALPRETKARYATPADGRGWVPPDAEANSYADGVATLPDMKETLRFGFADTGAQVNVWPDEVPELRPAVEAYLDASWDLAIALYELAEAALGLALGTLTEPSSRAVTDFNINLYPSRRSTGAPGRGQQRIGPHSDFGGLTVLDLEPGLGGLQIRLSDGTWVDAPHVPGALTINIGDLLAHWTGDRWRSTYHRVLPPPAEAPDESLCSLITFCGFDPETVVETLPVGGPTTYEPVLAGDYMAEKFAAISQGD